MNTPHADTHAHGPRTGLGVLVIILVLLGIAGALWAIAESRACPEATRADDRSTLFSHMKVAP